MLGLHQLEAIKDMETNSPEAQRWLIEYFLARLHLGADVSATWDRDSTVSLPIFHWFYDLKLEGSRIDIV